MKTQEPELLPVKALLVHYPISVKLLPSKRRMDTLDFVSFMLATIATLACGLWFIMMVVVQTLVWLATTLLPGYSFTPFTSWERIVAVQAILVAAFLLLVQLSNKVGPKCYELYYKVPQGMIVEMIITADRKTALVVKGHNSVNQLMTETHEVSVEDWRKKYEKGDYVDFRKDKTIGSFLFAQTNFPLYSMAFDGGEEGEE